LLSVLLFGATLEAFALPAMAVNIDLTSGTTGTVDVNQSFNGESRAADVTILSAVSEQVSSMTVANVSIAASGATVGARIYDSSQTLIASANVPSVPVASNQTFTVPISATLVAGSSYRLAFFVSSAPSGNDGNLFDPNPPSVGGFPYTESQGLFRVNSGWDGLGDVYPNATNDSIPLMSMVVAPVPEPASAALLVLGSAGLLLAAKSIAPSSHAPNDVNAVGGSPPLS
jgi:hypothetical protein